MTDSSPSSACVFLMVGKPSVPAAVIGEAVALVQPGSTPQAVASLAEARPVAGENAAVLLWFEPSATEVQAALAELDRARLPRWAVLVFGEAPVPEEVVAVPAEERRPAVIARAVRLARAIHRLRRENARSRGDLTTLGTRVVHDLRSPLGGVLTTVEVLKEVLAGEAPARVVLLDPILDSTDGLTRLVRQLSVVTKASGGENPRQRFNMALAFWAAAQRVEREANRLGVTIVQPSTWPEVEGDQGWVEAMWQALLANALRHGGRQPRVEAGWTSGEGENRFWVDSSGQVPPARRAALFTPFHLLHDPGAPRGFGLALVQRLAELQGGRTGFAPLTDGSRFYFTLPQT